MSRAVRWPAKSLFFADMVSLIVGLYVFRTLLVRWDSATFAGWEWLRVWLGICLLIPRNGLDIVAQRCAVRHAKSINAWTGIVLAVRIPLSLLASGVFVAVGRLIASAEWPVLVPLALTLPASAIAPDLAARVQGRFRTAGSLQALRNVILGCGIVVIPESAEDVQRFAWLTLAAELVVCMLWWLDALWHDGMPGGRWRVLWRRSRWAILARAWEQSLTRWLRVASWNIDALLTAPLAPGLWREVAPFRSLLMTAVVPFAGYLGAISPLLARLPQATLVSRFASATRSAMAIAFGGAIAAGLFGPVAWNAFTGAEPQADRLVMALTVARFGPLVVLLCETSFLTSLRRDAAARNVGVLQCTLVILAFTLHWLTHSDHAVYAAMISCEAVAAWLSMKIVMDKVELNKLLRRAVCVRSNAYAGSIQSIRILSAGLRVIRRAGVPER